MSEDRPKLKVVNVTSLEIPKRQSEVNQVARERIQQVLDSIDSDDVFALCMIVMTEGSIHDFYVRSENQSPFAIIGAVECLKRDMMRGMIQSRHDYVEYDDLK